MRTAWLKDLRLADLPQVGGKNASLGEMIGALSAAGIRVPGGFATTADAFREFLAQGGLDKKIEQRLEALDPKDVKALAACGSEIRSWILKSSFSAPLEKEIRSYFQQLEKQTSSETSFAIRSSATAEDLPDASFAGQQETFLNIRGIDHVLEAIRHVFASLYNDRAISYRAHQGFIHADVALSAAVQQMVRSDLGASGVTFTLDTESGFPDVVFITSSYGLGELLVQGAVNPDEFYVHKPTFRAGRRCVLRRAMGGKQMRMIYAGGHGAGSTANEPTPAADRALAQAGRSAGQMDAIKTHNPFALNDILFSRSTGFDIACMNNYGCSLVWGHPQAPMGTRAIIELIEELVLLKPELCAPHIERLVRGLWSPHPRVVQAAAAAPSSRSSTAPGPAETSAPPLSRNLRPTVTRRCSPHRLLR